MAPGDELREVLREMLTGHIKDINSHYDNIQINELVSKYNKLGLSAQDLKTNDAVIKGALGKSRNAVAIYVNLNDALQIIQEKTMNDATLAQNSKPNMGPGDELKNELKRIVDETGNITSEIKKVIIENVIDILNLEGINLTVTDLKENEEELKDIITNKYISIAIRKETLGTKLKAISDEKKQKINEAPLNDIEKSAGSRASDPRVGSNSIGKDKPITALQKEIINSAMQRNLDIFASQLANSPPKQASITNPFVNMALSDEEKFRKDIAEIIRGVSVKLDADRIANSIDLKGIDFSKIDLQDKDTKSTLVTTIKIRNTPQYRSDLPWALSTQLDMISGRATEPITGQAQQNLHNNPVESDTSFNPSNNVKIPDNEDTQSVKSNDSRIPVSPDPSRGKLSRDLKQGKGITNAQTKAQKSVQILKNSEIPAIRNVANELSNILEKEDRNTKILENIINESKREDLQKGCLELYDDIEPLLNSDLTGFENPIYIAFSDSIKIKETTLEETILEKLPERIAEAKYERSLSPEKISNILKGLGEESTLSGKSSYLKEEYGKLGVAGKSLAVAAVATIGTLGALASPFVLGAGLVAVPFVGTGIAAKKGKEALDKLALEGRQELADKKKNVGFGSTFTPKVKELAKEFIDFAVLKGRVGILRVAIKQSPELGNIISEADLNIIEKFITARTEKLEKLGAYNKVFKSLGEGAAEKILKLMEDIKAPKGLTPEESAYFHSLKKVVTKGFSASIKSAFSNKVITTGSEANRTLLKNIKKDNLADARDMLKNYSKLDEGNRKKFDTELGSKLGTNVNILDKRNPSGDELNTLAGAFSSLSKEDVKGLAERSAELLTEQKQEEKGILDKVKGVLDGVLDKMKDVSGKVKSLFTRGVSSEKAAGENKVTEL